LNLGLSALIGLLVGFGLAMLREVSDVTLRRVDEALEITGSTVLGALSFNPDVPEHPLTVHTSPKSHQAEAFRHLRTGVKFVEIATGVSTIVVSSSIPNEGKTVTASNLAIAMADSGSKVLLIDGDLRKPNIAKIMGVNGDVGLCDVLLGEKTMTSAVQKWGDNGLYVLPAGKVPPNPSELLGSKGMQQLLDRVRGTYDMVIIDAPPLLPVTDGIILSKLGGSLLMVVAIGKVKRPQLRNSIELLQNAGTVLLGLVLNKIPIKGVGSEVYRSGYGYGRGYGYGYGRGYGTYGTYGANSEPYVKQYPESANGSPTERDSGSSAR
jgi:capsular exopolysaccharide synthesis family protein